MPPPRKGHVKWHRDHWKARVRLADGTRPWVHFEPGLSEQEAIAQALEMSQIAKTEGLVRAGAPAPPADQETVREWAKRWLDHREGKGFSSTPVDRGRLATWVYDAIGKRPMAAVTKAELEGLVEQLDAHVAAGKLAWRTARNAWGLVTKMFADASGGKVKALRVRPDNPAAGIAATDRGVKKTKTYLYPSEFLALVRCAEVPMRWRRLFALAIYSYARAGELAALRWGAVDLERGVIHIHQSQDRFRKRGTIKATKSGVARKVPVEPALLPLMQLLHRERIDERVFPMPPGEALATRLRTYLLLAGVDRQELHADDATRKHITFHDLRATGITWMAARGDDPWKMKSRAGHSSISTTEGYVREVEAVGREVFGEVFPTLPAVLFGHRIGLGEGATAMRQGKSAVDLERPQRDSKARTGGRRAKKPQQKEGSGAAEAPPEASGTKPGTNPRGLLSRPERDRLRREVSVHRALRRGVDAALRGDESATLQALEEAAAGIPWARPA